MLRPRLQVPQLQRLTLACDTFMLRPQSTTDVVPTETDSHTYLVYFLYSGPNPKYCACRHLHHHVILATCRPLLKAQCLQTLTCDTCTVQAPTTSTTSTETGCDRRSQRTSHCRRRLSPSPSIFLSSSSPTSSVPISSVSRSGAWSALFSVWICFCVKCIVHLIVCF